MKKYFLCIMPLLLINLLAFAQEGVDLGKNEGLAKTEKSKNVILVSNRWEITLLKAYNTGNTNGGLYKTSFTVRDTKYDEQADEERKFRIQFQKVTSEKSNVYNSKGGFTNWKTLFKEQPQKDMYDVIWGGTAPGNIKKFIFIEGTLLILVDGVEMKKPFSSDIDLEVE